MTYLSLEDEGRFSTQNRSRVGDDVLIGPGIGTPNIASLVT